jgi:hypothetical protein
MEWQPWPRADERGLARYVTPLAKRWLPLNVSVFDLAREADGRRKVIAALYDALLQQQVRYALEDYHPSAALQRVRTPADVLTTGSREGTCLDLAVLFSGLCLGCDLLPVLVVTAGHALTVVALDRGVRDRRFHPGSGLFARSQLTPGDSEQWDRFLSMVDAGTYLAIECTGFAHSEALAVPGSAVVEAGHGKPFPEAAGRQHGRMSFADAIRAGRAQLAEVRRPLAFAFDVATAHYDWRIEPFVPIFQVIDRAKQLFPAVAHHVRDLDFRPLIDNRTRGFVGRNFVFEGIDAILADREKFPSGYIVVRGEPGVGKTALVSELVKRRGYLHHFNVVQENITSAATFLANACAQLIVRYDLPHTELPPRATADSGFLKQMLAEAAARADGQRVVLLVDALDEAEVAAVAAGRRKANRLMLPRDLPEGVVLIVTSREMVADELDVDLRQTIDIEDNDPRNLDDVSEYIRRFVGDSTGMSERVREWGGTDVEFVSALTAKSQGNFMYVKHVLRDIRAGRISRATIDRLDHLPTGLKEYYASHWDAMRRYDEDVFERLFEPVVFHLAVVREPVSVEQLAEWTHLRPAEVRRVVEAWREFLNEERRLEGPAYRVYHTSFQDFLSERVDLRRYDARIADHIMRKIGLWEPRGGTA